ncbi:MAG: hypothetical protein Kow0065_07350 [Methylomicrobium sp.]
MFAYPYLSDTKENILTRIEGSSRFNNISDDGLFITEFYDHASKNSEISNNGIFTVLWSSLGLVTGDNNNSVDIYRKDSVTGTTAWVSQAYDGKAGNAAADPLPDMSSNGLYIVFSSAASNLVPGDVNGKKDVFLKNMQTGELALVSTNAAGTQGNGDAYSARVSDDGRYVLFASDDTSWTLNGQAGGKAQWYVKDMQTGALTRVSTDAAGQKALDIAGTGAAAGGDISADGRYVAFTSYAANLVPNDTNGFIDVFVKDIVTGAIARVSVNANGEEANNSSLPFRYNDSGAGSYRELVLPVAISGDGRWLAFASAASNLVPDDTNGKIDVFKAENPLFNGGTTPTLSVSSTSVVESNGFLNFLVSLNTAGSSPVTVNYATSNGTATAGSDYSARSQTLTIPAGSLQATISVPVIDDSIVESNETLTLTLSNPVNATLGTGSATGTIIDNDVSTPSLSKDDNIVLLQYASPPYVGAAEGNDTYMIFNSLMVPGTNITITDPNGNNSIQLVDGLSIASSKVASNALQLTLASGAVVNILGADQFGYDAGGNLTLGIDNPDLSFANFVQTVLGVTVPSSGVVNGGAVVIGNTSSVIDLVAGSSLSVAATSEAEIFTFDVGASKALTSDTQVQINGFDVNYDALRIDTATALGQVQLNALNGVDGIAIQSNLITHSILINFGSDANGDPVALTLLGITDPALVNVNVI